MANPLDSFWGQKGDDCILFGVCTPALRAQGKCVPMPPPCDAELMPIWNARQKRIKGIEGVLEAAEAKLALLRKSEAVAEKVWEGVKACKGVVKCSARTDALRESKTFEGSYEARLAEVETARAKAQALAEAGATEEAAEVRKFHERKRLANPPSPAVPSKGLEPLPLYGLRDPPPPYGRTVPGLRAAPPTPEEDSVAVIIGVGALVAGVLAAGVSLFTYDNPNNKNSESQAVEAAKEAVATVVETLPPVLRDATLAVAVNSKKPKNKDKDERIRKAALELAQREQESKKHKQKVVHFAEEVAKVAVASVALESKLAHPEKAKIRRTTGLHGALDNPPRFSVARMGLPEPKTRRTTGLHGALKNPSKSRIANVLPKVTLNSKKRAEQAQAYARYEALSRNSMATWVRLGEQEKKRLAEEAAEEAAVQFLRPRRRRVAAPTSAALNAVRVPASSMNPFNAPTPPPKAEESGTNPFNMFNVQSEANGSSINLSNRLVVLAEEIEKLKNSVKPADLARVRDLRKEQRVLTGQAPVKPVESRFKGVQRSVSEFPSVLTVEQQRQQTEINARARQNQGTLRLRARAGGARRTRRYGGGGPNTPMEIGKASAAIVLATLEGKDRKEKIDLAEKEAKKQGFKGDVLEYIVSVIEKEV